MINPFISNHFFVRIRYTNYRSRDTKGDDSMKLERLSENQIRCTLNKADLADRELMLNELAYGTDKAKELFRDMMEQASVELGFEANDIPLMIEAIPVSPECLVLIVTKVEDPEELDTRFSRFTKPAMEEYDDNDIEDEDEFEEHNHNGMVPATDSLLEALGSLAENLNALNNNRMSKKTRSAVKTESNKNVLDAYIINDDDIYIKVLNYMSNSSLILTKGLNDFNVATANTSYAKCTQDYNYYLMKCYDYFIYVFDKKNKRCFMIIKNNKKALTMINILILTPYLMYGELFAVHGGLVNKDDKNILINNSSLGGKTTFAILFANNNYFNVFLNLLNSVSKSNPFCLHMFLAKFSTPFVSPF